MFLSPEVLVMSDSIHFVGIGGVSMSALAELMLARGVRVTGSDLIYSEAVARLEGAGALIHIGHDEAYIQGAKLVVHTAAVPANNPEVCAARQAGIPVVERAQFLGAILRLYEKPIGVSGTHGKTTTTSMISQVLLHANLDPTLLIGGVLPLIGHNCRIGSSPYVVYEACEYVDSFFHFCAWVTVILNIDNDHLDYFSDIDHIKRSFATYAGNTLPGGVVVANADDQAVADALRNHRGRVVSFSLKDPKADYYAEIKIVGSRQRFDVYEDGALLGSCSLRVPGQHNVLNALAAIAACRQIDIPFATISSALLPFGGAKRRFEVKGWREGVCIADDYAHHPTEMVATMSAARELDYKRIVCVFQPHTFSRTIAHFDAFVQALSLPDIVVLLDIYPSREPHDPSVSSKMIADRVVGANYCSSMEAAKELIVQLIQPGDLVLTMGAGDVFKVGDALLQDT